MKNVLLLALASAAIAVGALTDGPRTLGDVVPLILVDVGCLLILFVALDEARRGVWRGASVAAVLLFASTFASATRGASISSLPHFLVVPDAPARALLWAALVAPAALMALARVRPAAVALSAIGVVVALVPAVSYLLPDRHAPGAAWAAVVPTLWEPQTVALVAALHALAAFVALVPRSRAAPVTAHVQ